MLAPRSLTILLLTLLAAGLGAQSEATAAASPSPTPTVVRHQPAHRHTGTRIVRMVVPARTAVEASVRRDAMPRRSATRLHLRR
ncbi:MAG: hypothetical protein JNL08_02475 [Planctomycetes bacterium]|nr:hypothetical protein [Planctomycetota bacterium]